MQIPKEQVLDFLREQGKSGEAAQAERELPGQVDTDRDAGLLEKFGVSPQEILSKLGGGGIPGL